MSSEKLNLSSEFEKIQIDPHRKRNELTNEALRHQLKSTPEQYLSNLKVKDRRKNLIKPSRLKIIGNSYKSQNKVTKDDVKTTENAENLKDVDTFASEAFLAMRITSKDQTSPASQAQSSQMCDEKDDKTPTPSQSCSAQAKLQQQLSSSEFDSTIDEMSDYFSYHLSLYKDKNYLVDSMYT